MNDCIVVHYGEIAIKGKNRAWFERILIENIQKALKGLKYKGVKKYYGRLVIQYAEDSPEEEMINRLKNVFGISYVAPAVSCKLDVDEMKKKALEILKENPPQSLNVVAKRSNKHFALKSPDINREVGKMLQEKLNITVDYIAPEERLFIEVTEGKIFLYRKKIQGLRGLPVGCSGKVMVLLSGGIDSPVASFYAMKRGCTPIYIHFHSYPYTKDSSIEKAKELVKILSKFKQESKLFIVPFIDIQKQIMEKAEKKYRVVLYRRFMMRIAERIAYKEGAKALVTGENLGQVASQTLDNLAAIEKVTSLPILRPVIGFDKQEIINVAKEIGTYEKSIEPHDDCCSLFVPQHPVTKAEPERLERMESLFDGESIVREIVKKAEKVIV